MKAVVNDNVEAAVWVVDPTYFSDMFVAANVLRQRGISNVFVGSGDCDKDMFLLKTDSDDPIGFMQREYLLPPYRLLLISDDPGRVESELFRHPGINAVMTDSLLLSLDSQYLGDTRSNYSGSTDSGAFMSAEELSSYNSLMADGRFEEAMSLLRASYKRGKTWPGLELVDRLIERGNPADIKEAFEICYRNRNGDPQFKYRLGKMYKQGLGTDRDLNRAIGQLEVAEDADVPGSADLLIDTLLEVGDANSINKARALCEKHSSNVTTLVKLARIYRDGKGVEKDEGKAADILRSISNKSGLARNELIDTLVSKGDYSEAFDLAQRFASSDAWTQARLARMYRDGKGVGKDLDKAIELMGSARDRGVAFAGKEIVSMRASRGDSEDLSSVLKELESNPNDSYLLATVGRMYKDGNGVVKDEAKALDMINRAYDSGAEWVRNDLIDLLVDRGSDADCKKAFALAREKQNDPWTEFRLAKMYRDGKGTRANLDKAIKLMRDARDRGVTMAIPEMDDLLYRRRSQEDLRELYADLKPRAEEGDPWANAKIARLYRDGAGTEKSIDKAIEALKIAVEGGVPWAEKELADLLAKKK